MAGNRAVFSRYRVLILFFVTDIVNRSLVDHNRRDPFPGHEGTCSRYPGKGSTLILCPILNVRENALSLP